eukprot:c9970_g1_i1.p1 GENE.c9970_g1_i1~~c9970_g1_i1.p1  ORF type:complete len:771 (+),score=171.00 c9970_g1_i1:83-2314(+)
MEEKEPVFSFRVGILCLVILYLSVLTILVVTNCDVRHFCAVGGAIGIICCITTLAHALLEPSARSHPDPLILWKTLTDLLIAIRFIWHPAMITYDSSEDCRFASSVLQFLGLASQGWVLCVAVDLWKTLSNPFLSYRKWVRYYHMLCWGAAFISALIMLFNDNAYGMFMAPPPPNDLSNQWCWFRTIDSEDFWHLQKFTWLLFYIPTMMILTTSVGVVMFVAWKLRKGLQTTFAWRLRVISINAVNIATSAVFWFTCTILYLFYYRTSNANCKRALMFIVSSFGFTDLLVWIAVNQFRSFGSDLDMAPGANYSLQDEFTQALTYGVRVVLRQPQPSPLTKQRVEVPLSRMHFVSLGSLWRQFLSPGKMRRTPEPPQESEEVQSQGVQFYAFAPAEFHRVRVASGMSPDQFLVEFQDPIEPKLTDGGASGAFFCYSNTRKFILKSISEQEALLWTKPACRTMSKTRAFMYANHIEAHSQTYLTKVYGVFSLKIYGTVFYSMLMNNVGYTERNIEIHEKYDLKGSSLNRTAHNPVPNQDVFCRHCGEKYAYSRKPNVPCSGIVRFHEPLLVFKDNDLKYKIRVEDPVSFIEQLDADTEFLSLEFNTMDYSLLVLVHKEEVVVERKSDWGGCLVAQAMQGPACYYIGIIDILQEWTLQKRLERFVKIILYQQDPVGISAQEPTAYRKRFLEKMRVYTNYSVEPDPAGRKMSVVSPSENIESLHSYFQAVEMKPKTSESTEERLASS